MIPHKREFWLNAEIDAYEFGVFSQSVTLHNTTEEINYLSIFYSVLMLAKQYWYSCLVMEQYVEPMKLSYFKINNKYVLIMSGVMYMLWSWSIPPLKQYKFIYRPSLFENTFSYMKVYFYDQPQDFLFVMRIHSCTKDIFMCKHKMWVLVTM